MKRLLGFVLFLIGILCLVLEFVVWNITGILGFLLATAGIIFVLFGLGFMIKIKGKDLILFIVEFILDSIS